MSQDSEFTTCQGTHADWYTSMTGETPCTSYQRLRQICEPDFRVGQLTPNTPSDQSTPPDSCPSQTSTCCCNSVAFSLAMLCLNCQQNHGGYDVSAGAYGRFLGGAACIGRSLNGSLHASVQDRVCEQEPQLRIPDFVQEVFWGDGAWFFGHTRNQTVMDFQAKGNSSFSKCPQRVAQVPTPSGTPPPPPSPSPSRAMSTGAIAGIAIGGVVLVGLIAAVALLLRRRRRKTDFSEKYVGQPVHQDIAPFTPALRPGGEHQHSEGSSKTRSPPPSTGVPSDSRQQAVYERDAGPVMFPPQYDENWRTPASSSNAAGSGSDRNVNRKGRGRR